MTPHIEQIIDIAETAGKEILLPAFHKQGEVFIKQDGSVVTQTDATCQSFLQKELSKIAPAITFLGEEMHQKEQLACLQSKGMFWCVDPLDGTSNFITPIPLFAISIALIQNGKPVMACIYDPIRQESFTAIQGEGSKLNGTPIQASPEKLVSNTVGFVDFKRLNHQLASHFATHKIYRSQRNIGSCALEWAWLAAGRGQFIIHGGEKIWDYAAGSLLAEESGCNITNFDGIHPFLSQELSSSIIAAPQPIHQQLIASF